MDDRKFPRRHTQIDDRKFPRRRTQIDDIPSSLSRLPIKTSTVSRLVCKTWFLLFSDPLFVRLQLARSPTCILRRKERPKKNLKFRLEVGEVAGEDLEFEVNVSLPDSISTCDNSCHGLLCFENCVSGDEIYVCNPILREYITIPIVNRESLGEVKSVLGFCSKSNQFKVLQIHSRKRRPGAYMAEIYTIGSGTQQWKSIGRAPSCTFRLPDDSVNSFVNGSIHWMDKRSQQIAYFDFESEQFGWLPSPPPWRDDGRWSTFTKVKLGVVDGRLCIYAFCYHHERPVMWEIKEKWAMKEYGVGESWTPIYKNLDFTECFFRPWCGTSRTTTYSPSFISLQDVAESEKLTVLSRTTRIKDQDSMEVISNIESSEDAFEGGRRPEIH